MDGMVAGCSGMPTFKCTCDGVSEAKSGTREGTHTLLELSYLYVQISVCFVRYGEQEFCFEL